MPQNRRRRVEVMSGTRPLKTGLSEADAADSVKRWEIVIDGWRPASLNELLRGGPWGAHRLKRRDREYVVLFANLARVPRATAKRRVSLRIVLPPKQRRWDEDALWKSLLDACVLAGLLKDDDPKWCELGGVDYVRGKALSTTIIVEDIA
jgi:hypothetical protein